MTAPLNFGINENTLQFNYVLEIPHRLFTAYVLNQIDYMEVNPSKYKQKWEGEIGKIVCLSACVERKRNG